MISSNCNSLAQHILDIQENHLCLNHHYLETIRHTSNNYMLCALKFQHVQILKMIVIFAIWLIVNSSIKRKRCLNAHATSGRYKPQVTLLTKIGIFWVLQISEELSNKGNKNTYFNTMEKDLNVIGSIQEKWSKTLNEDGSDSTLQNAFKAIQNYSPSTYQRYNQFKLLHRRIINNQILKKMNIIKSDICL